MPLYRIKTKKNEYVEVEAQDLDEALRKAGVDSCEFYEVDHTVDLRKRCLFSAIADEILDGE